MIVLSIMAGYAFWSGWIGRWSWDGASANVFLGGAHTKTLFFRLLEKSSV